MFQTSLGRSSLVRELCLGVIVGAFLAPAPPIWGQPFTGHPIYPINFSTDASSTPTPYSTPGFEAQFSLPGGDILGAWLGQGLQPVGLACARPGVLCAAGPAGMGMGFVSPADVLCTNNGGPPWVWAPAAALGLNPSTDDIDALAILMTSDPALSPVPPGALYRGYEAFIVFSVTPSSGIVGTNDVLWNIPIMPSDILTEATRLGFPGRVAILIPAGGLGIFPFLQRPPGVFTDNLDALQIYSTPMRDARLVDWVEWESFILGGDPEGWLPEGTIQEWNDTTLPSSATLPEGPLDPNVLVNNPNDFRRGDSNQDGQMDMSDAVFTLGFLFLGTKAPACDKAADANDSGDLDLSDPVYTLMFLFTGGKQPPAPYPACGPDETQDNLSCTSYSKC